MIRAEIECPKCDTGVIQLSWIGYRVIGRRGLTVEIQVDEPCGTCGHAPATDDEALAETLIERNEP